LASGAALVVLQKFARAPAPLSAASVLHSTSTFWMMTPLETALLGITIVGLVVVTFR
jgi:hypothetical protein